MDLFKFSKKLILLLLVSIFLSGCEFSEGSYIDEMSDFVYETFKGKSSTEEEYVSPNSSGDIIVVEKVEKISDEEVEIFPDTDEKLSNTDFSTAQKNLIKDSMGYYCFELLDDKEKLIYTEVLNAITSLSKDVRVSCKEESVLDKVFSCVMLDHPEIFYVSGYSFTKFVRGESVEKINITPTYTMDKDQVIVQRKNVENYVDQCVSSYNGSTDEYEKVKYVYEYLIKNNEYDLNAENNQNILSVVNGHKTVCQGYAKATQYILGRMGVFSILCEGTVKGSEAHAWNIVKINGEYYHVDTTWGDSSYNITGAEGQMKVPDINYDYLCITDEEISKTHVVKKVVNVPECTSLNANYYVREGLYFTELDATKLKMIFDDAIEKNETIVTIKCQDANVYAAIVAHLIESRKVFEYVQSSTIEYTEFKDAYRISFFI